MIRATLAATKAATFSIDLPSVEGGPPTPTGTGFFVSPDGWFVTAAHVVAKDGVARADVGQAWLMKEPGGERRGSAMVQWPDIDFIDEARDFALLRLDFKRNEAKDFLSGLGGFPYLRVSERELDEGEPVYAFGYPLSDAVDASPGKGVDIILLWRRPRVTSAIIAAHRFEYGPVVSSNDVQQYVLDKALNYGNSGGPIVATETGRVHAFCRSFQPVAILQEDRAPIQVPSLYGVVGRLSDPAILNALRSRGVEVTAD